jgi:HPt (histidine-containing phosphotransfer) domain-containing protein
MLKAFYQTIGGDYNEVTSRLPTEKMILRFLLRFKDDGTYRELCLAMEERRLDDAFRAVHTLKGITLNLGLARLGKSSHDLTEALRPRTESCNAEALSALFGAVCRDYDEVLSALTLLQA